MRDQLTTPVLKRSNIDAKGFIHYDVEGGMTKRELFAAMAMQGLCTVYGYSWATTARAVEIADALIIELSKRTETKGED